MEDVCDYPKKCLMCGGILQFISYGGGNSKLLTCLNECIGKGKFKSYGEYFVYQVGEHNIISKVS